MKALLHRSVIILGSLCSLVAFAATTPQANIVKPGETPAGLETSSWQSILSQIEQDNRDIRAGADGRLQAAHARQNLAFEFSSDGASVSHRTKDAAGTSASALAVRLARFGREGAMQDVTPTTDIVHEKNRVEYRHGNVTEWYVNTADGLEQGFTLATRPSSGKGDLRLDVAFSTGLRPVLTADASAVELMDTAGNVSFTYNKLIVTDATGSQIPARMALASGASDVTLIVEDTDAAYPLIVDPLIATQQQKLTASDGAAGDEFGNSVAISGDTLVVGTRKDAEGANSDQGSAYVFTRSGTTWTQQQKLIASDRAAGDFFGHFVAISGETVVVGAIGDDEGVIFNQGSVYVFTRSGTTWTQQQKLTASDSATDDYFGSSVAISGETVVVGAIGDDVGANSNQGSAYVFIRSGTTWTQQQKLTASDGAKDDVFGLPVVISGETVVVGAPGKNFNQGSAYVFTRSGTTWTQQQKLTASDGAALDKFGNSVAISGETVVVGAPGDDYGSSYSEQGAAYVFTRSGTTWTQQQKLTASEIGDRKIGSSVAISGETLVVGAPVYEWKSGSKYYYYPGCAYVFTRSGTTWTQQQKLTISTYITAPDYFGVSMAISGETLVVGATADDYGSNYDQGSAHVYSISLTPPTDISLSSSVVNVAGGANAEVGALSTMDATVGDTFTYTLVSGTGDTNNALFNLSGSSLRANNASTMALGTYSVRIRSTDSTGLYIEKAFSLKAVMPSRLYNLSIRAKAGGNGPLIVGFTPTNSNGTPMLVRAIGPTLGTAPFNVPGVMADPRLDVYSGGTVVASNDNWGTEGVATMQAAFASAGAFGLANTASLDAAKIHQATGARTVHINGASGVVIVEAYDRGDATTPRLTNLSARNFCGTGADVMICGFTIAGEAPMRLLVRAVGPGLSQWIPSGLLADPKLEIHTTVNGADTTVATNDNWSSETGAAAAMTTAGAFALPAGSKDAVLVRMLNPGSYTAIASGLNNGTGEVLIELYELP